MSLAEQQSRGLRPLIRPVPREAGLSSRGAAGRPPAHAGVFLAASLLDRSPLPRHPHPRNRRGCARAPSRARLVPGHTEPSRPPPACTAHRVFLGRRHSAPSLWPVRAAVWVIKPWEGRDSHSRCEWSPKTNLFLGAGCQPGSKVQVTKERYPEAAFRLRGEINSGDHQLGVKEAVR